MFTSTIYSLNSNEDSMIVTNTYCKRKIVEYLAIRQRGSVKKRENKCERETEKESEREKERERELLLP